MNKQSIINQVKERKYDFFEIVSISEMDKNKMLERAFEYLTEIKNKQISISEFCDYCKISKTTFYKNFNNVQELYDELYDKNLNDIKNSIINNVDIYNVGTDSKAVFLNVLVVLLKELLKYKNLTVAFYYFYKESFLIKIKKRVDSFLYCYFKANTKDEKELAFLLSGIAALIVSWMKGYLDCDEEELARSIVLEVEKTMGKNNFAYEQAIKMLLEGGLSSN